MPDQSHVCWPILGPQAYRIVVQYHIHDPVQAVFDSPMRAARAWRGGTGCRGRHRYGESRAPKPPCKPAPFHALELYEVADHTSGLIC